MSKNSSASAMLIGAVLLVLGIGISAYKYQTLKNLPEPNTLEKRFEKEEQLKNMNDGLTLEEAARRNTSIINSMMNEEKSEKPDENETIESDGKSEKE